MALLLQTWNVFAGYTKPDFILVFLLISALFLDFPKIFLMILVSIFFLSWRPNFNLDLLAFALLPILAFLLRKFIHGRIELIGFLTVFFGTIIFYSVSALQSFWSNLGLAGELMIWNLVFGSLVFFVMLRFLNPSR